MSKRIVIQSERINPKIAESALSPLGSGQDIAFKIEQSRGIDTGLLVAVVGAAGTGLGALITGILKLASDKSAKRIVLQGKNGRRVEVPTGLSDSELSKIIESAKALDVDKITF
jgi:hypothetical protein